MRLGDRGDGVTAVQYMLSILAEFDDALTPVTPDGVFGPETQRAVQAYQRWAGLADDGVVGPATWNAMFQRFIREEDALEEESCAWDSIRAMPCVWGRRTQRGEDDMERSAQTVRPVWGLQYMLSRLAEKYPFLPKLTPDGVFGERTLEAVMLFQRELLRPVTGWWTGRPGTRSAGPGAGWSGSRPPPGL